MRQHETTNFTDQRTIKRDTIASKVYGNKDVKDKP